MNRVTDNVVAIELGDATFIATTTQNYHLCSKEDKKGVYQVVPPSGHFIFQAPHDQYIEFRGKTVQKFHGRHDKLVINPFNVYEKLGMFETHEELEEWNENQRRVGKGLDTIDMMLLHDIQQSNSSFWDNFIHTVKAHPYWSTFGSMLFVLIVAVFIISIMKWCWRKCRRTRNKGINEKRDQERGFDATTKEFRGIHNV
ncbi:hypothetical protein CAEBREN_22461 [Caenorhabditis brenneri]|uniref:Uncharacterized protein n=1 Tax=Caenorhabditis brenneri TaxID=135651 RepID=G0P5Z9_CAEBE|nr:hypothetical protein CAEBREN_22461 [Caenorhabditis brenneri]